MGPFGENAHSISNPMTERQAYIAFNLTERVGSATLARLKAEFGSAVAAWDAYPKKVSRAGGEVDWAREEALARKYGVTLLTAADDGYPERLRQAPGGPLVLYVKGDVAALSPSRRPVFMQPHRAALSARMQTKIERHLRKFMINALPCSPILHRKGFF